MNPFVIFQMTPTLNIDRVLLDQRYFAFQRVLHPDRLQNGSVQVQQWAEQHISQINQAYKALQDMLLIAKATALYLQDPTLGLEQFNDNDIPMLDSDFLSNIVRLQTQGTPEDVAQLFDQVIEDLDTSIRELSLTGVLNSIARLTYVGRLRKLIQET
jgi:curved DNA-binding protein CbpA